MLIVVEAGEGFVESSKPTAEEGGEGGIARCLAMFAALYPRSMGATGAGGLDGMVDMPGRFVLGWAETGRGDGMEVGGESQR